MHKSNSPTARLPSPARRSISGGDQYAAAVPPRKFKPTFAVAMQVDEVVAKLVPAADGR
jgi:hypothetical protein